MKKLESTSPSMSMACVEVVNVMGIKMEGLADWECAVESKEGHAVCNPLVEEEAEEVEQAFLQKRSLPHRRSVGSHNRSANLIVADWQRKCD
ncbi:hypothetical protein BLNAU_16429 [Blattamonas nauphoetae]|uniref:Uncharacterized protein n=1 Tax=Blattamonas nauphoetae TaxID=2049346 RepID=A0ABQ9XEF9_9EUKA|nr:hypothetical protein BLNAU_16429 [Blattamonas nauphoetae]